MKRFHLYELFGENHPLAGCGQPRVASPPQRRDKLSREKRHRLTSVTRAERYSCNTRRLVDDQQKLGSGETLQLRRNEAKEGKALLAVRGWTALRIRHSRFSSGNRPVLRSATGERMDFPNSERITRCLVGSLRYRGPCKRCPQDLPGTLHHKETLSRVSQSFLVKSETVQPSQALTSLISDRLPGRSTPSAMPDSWRPTFSS